MSDSFICLMVFVFVYAFPALCLHLIANKVGESDGWHAWVPIANLLLLCRMGEQSGWWALACFIPYVGSLIVLGLQLNIPKAMGIESPAKYIMLIPGANLFYMGYLAFRTE